MAPRRAHRPSPPRVRAADTTDPRLLEPDPPASATGRRGVLEAAARASPRLPPPARPLRARIWLARTDPPWICPHPPPRRPARRRYRRKPAGTHAPGFGFQKTAPGPSARALLSRSSPARGPWRATLERPQLQRQGAAAGRLAAAAVRAQLESRSAAHSAVDARRGSGSHNGGSSTHEARLVRVCDSTGGGGGGGGGGDSNDDARHPGHGSAVQPRGLVGREPIHVATAQPPPPPAAAATRLLPDYGDHAAPASSHRGHAVIRRRADARVVMDARHHPAHVLVASADIFKPRAFSSTDRACSSAAFTTTRTTTKFNCSNISNNPHNDDVQAAPVHAAAISRKHELSPITNTDKTHARGRGGAQSASRGGARPAPQEKVQAASALPSRAMDRPRA